MPVTLTYSAVASVKRYENGATIVPLIRIPPIAVNSLPVQGTAGGFGGTASSVPRAWDDPTWQHPNMKFPVDIPVGIEGIHTDQYDMVIQVKDTAYGYPAQPSLKMTRRGSFCFKWPVAPGARTISIYVKNQSGSGPYPTLTVKANLDCGVQNDVTATAIAGTGWQIIGPITINPSVNGVVIVQLSKNAVDGLAVNFDHIVVT